MSRNSEFGEVTRYLKQLSGSRLLTREEEVSLSRKVKQGDWHARAELVRNNLALVVAIAKRHTGRGAHLNDLIQEGNLGLLKAVENFDPDRGNRFSTYAVWWIRSFITRFVEQNRSQVRGGERERAARADLSLNAPLGDDDSEVNHLDRLADETPGAEASYISEEHGDQVRTILNQLRETIGGMAWDIVEQRLSQEDGSTLAEIGERWGVSQERVRQVELRTKRILFAHLVPLAA